MSDQTPEPAAPTGAERRARAERIIAMLGEEDVYTALTALLTQIRDWDEFGGARYQQAVDHSRTDWHYQQVTEDPTKIGGRPRAQTWRQHLGKDRLIGEYWRSWPPELKTQIVTECVRIEAEAITQGLADLNARHGIGAVWDPQRGITIPNAEFGVYRFHSDEFDQIRAAAYLAVLDDYDDLETRTVTAFTQAKIEQLEQRGYSVDIGPPIMGHDCWVSPEPHNAHVAFYVDDGDGPMTVDVAKAWADFAKIADGLPPVEVNHDDPSWYRQDYLDQMQSVAEAQGLDEATAKRFVAALADARTAAINEALDGTDHAWDPRIDLAVPLPTEKPQPLGNAHLAAIEAAKAAVDPAEVFEDTIAPDPWGPVALAFPAAAPPAQVDTGAAAETTTYSTAPAPEL